MKRNTVIPKLAALHVRLSDVFKKDLEQVKHIVSPAAGRLADPSTTNVRMLTCKF